MPPEPLTERDTALALGALGAQVQELLTLCHALTAALEALRRDAAPLLHARAMAPAELEEAQGEVAAMRVKLADLSAEIVRLQGQIDARPTPILRIASAFGDAARALLRGYTWPRLAWTVAVAFVVRLVFLIDGATANGIAADIGAAVARWISSAPPATVPEMTAPADEVTP
jgi:hypothetical protein